MIVSSPVDADHEEVRPVGKAPTERMSDPDSGPDATLMVADAKFALSTSFNTRPEARMGLSPFSVKDAAVALSAIVGASLTAVICKVIVEGELLSESISGSTTT